MHLSLAIGVSCRAQIRRLTHREQARSRTEIREITGEVTLNILEGKRI